MIRRNPQKLVEQQQSILNYLLKKVKELEVEIKMYQRVIGMSMPGGGGAGVTDHGALAGLTDDDHTQYASLNGRSGGQTLKGGTAASENLNLQSTSHATKGDIVADSDIDIGSKHLLYSNISLREYGTAYLRIYDRAGINIRHLSCNILNLGRIECTLFNYLSLYTRAVNDSKFEIYAYDSGYKLMAGSYGGTHGGCFKIPRGGDITMLDQMMLTIGTYTDAQRPAAGTVGRVIFNTDDGMPNYDDGSNWRDVNGNIT